MPYCDICGIETPHRVLRRCVCAAQEDKDCRLCPSCLRTRTCGKQATCLLCDGKGYIPRKDNLAISVRCPRCDGSGLVPLIK